MSDINLSEGALDTICQGGTAEKLVLQVSNLTIVGLIPGFAQLGNCRNWLDLELVLGQKSQKMWSK
jgi:hypothetical protein